MAKKNYIATGESYSIPDLRASRGDLWYVHFKIEKLFQSVNEMKVFDEQAKKNIRSSMKDLVGHLNKLKNRKAIKTSKISEADKAVVSKAVEDALFQLGANPINSDPVKSNWPDRLINAMTDVMHQIHAINDRIGS